MAPSLPPSLHTECNLSYSVYLVRGRIWSVYSLTLAYQVASAVWRLAGRLPSRLLQNTVLFGKFFWFAPHFDEAIW
jgi:hypothetical protein